MAKSFPALFTIKWFFFGMGVLVISEVVHSSKSLATCFARVRSFVSVGSLVDEEIVTFGKGSLAIFADIGFFGS